MKTPARKRKTQPPRSVVTGAHIGELLLIASAVEGHAAAIKTRTDQLLDCARKLDVIRDRLKLTH